jgi:hypothetical protein
MKSKSPFSKKSPIKLQVYRGDTYESPDTVITKTVGEQVGAAITGLADNAVDYMDNYKKTKKPSEAIASVGLGGGKYKGFGGGMKEINLPETPDVNTNLTNPNDFSKFTGSTDLVNKGKSERGIKTVNGRKVLTHEANADKLGYKKGTQERADFIKASTADNIKNYKTDEPTREGKAKNYITMKGSPNKLIGDTMDPYGQPQRGNRDFTFNENEIAPGTLGSQASVGVQKEIFGGGQAQAIASQAANSLRDDKMDLIGNTDSMLAMKGFAKTQEELIDETKFEELPKENTMGYNVQDITSIKTDKKGQEYMVDIETRRDTIRPAQGDIKFPRLKSKNKGRTFNR